MTELRADKCGKPVGLAGHPCMRVPGHPGICLSGLELSKTIHPSTGIYQRRIPWKLIAAAIFFWVLVCVQITVDVYLLVR